MLAYPFEEKRLDKWEKPWIVQPKLDGERCRAFVDEAGGIKLLSSEENEITGVPHIRRELENLYKGSNCEIELDGELYVHGMPFNEIHSRVSREEKNLHTDYQSIEYHIFDIVSTERQAHRSARVSGLPTDRHICLVPSTVVYLKDELYAKYERLIEAGYEGFIIRNKSAPYLRKRSTYMMKFKPKAEDWYQIVGSEEEVSIHGEKKGRLGALLLHNPDPYTPGFFKVGTGFTAQQREELWKQREKIMGLVAVVKYQHKSEKGVPRFPVFVDIVDPKQGLSSRNWHGG